jgi:hypothetical protein
MYIQLARGSCCLDCERVGRRGRLIDKFELKIYVSGKQDEIERLCSRFYINQDVAKWAFAEKFAHPTDMQKSRVLRTRA